MTSQPVSASGSEPITDERLAELIAEHERSAMLYCAMNGVKFPRLEQMATIVALRELQSLRSLRQQASEGAQKPRCGFDPVLLSMLYSAVDHVPPTLRGAVLRAYDYINEETPPSLKEQM